MVCNSRDLDDSSKTNRLGKAGGSKIRKFSLEKDILCIKIIKRQVSLFFNS